MKRILTLALLAAAALAPAGARAETLNLLIWEEYISDDVLARWTEETGVEVRQIFFDNGEDRDRLIADPNADIDLAILNENISSLYSRNGKLVEVTPQTVPSSVHSVQRWADRCSGHGIPYFWGTLGIVYRTDKFATPPGSWTDMLDPAPELVGHIAMLSTYDDLLSPSLIMAGKSVSTENEDDLKGAFEMLKGQAPAVRTYDYIVTSVQDESMGEDLYMGLAYSGDQFTLADITGHDWAYALPREGSVLWVDCLAAIASSSRRDLAVRFLDFINQPDIAAQNARELRTSSANVAAMALLPREMVENQEIYPPEATIEASHFYHEYAAPIIQLRKRITSALLSIHDAR